MTSVIKDEVCNATSQFRDFNLSTGSSTPLCLASPKLQLSPFYQDIKIKGLINNWLEFLKIFVWVALRNLYWIRKVSPTMNILGIAWSMNFATIDMAYEG